MRPHQKLLLKGLETLLAERLLCDVSLKSDSDDACVPVHRCILAASSPYFRAMFTLDTAESCQDTIQLHGVSGQVLIDLVQFLYTGSILLNTENVQALATVAEMMQIITLLEECESYMSSALCSENCVEVYNFADFLSMTELKSSAEKCILDNFLDIHTSEEFLKLRLQSVTKILSSDELNVQSEETVFSCALEWLKYDFEHRKKDLILLLLCIRFPLISDDYLNNVISTETLIKDNAFCNHVVQRAREFKRKKKTETETPDQIQFNSKPRFGMCNRKMLIFSGGSHVPADRSFCCFDPDTDASFHTIKHHPTFDFKCKIDFYRLIVTDADDIYFIGGIFYDDYHFESSGGMAKNTVLVYNQREGKWQEVAPMKHPRCAFGACYFDGKLYVFGGYTKYPNHPPIEDVEVYEIIGDCWRELDKLPDAIAHQAVTVFNDSALLLGGLDADKEPLNIVLQYKFSQDQWTILSTEMPQARSAGTAITHGSSIFILGGYNNAGNLLSVHIYDIERKRWSHAEDFPDDRKFTSITKGDNCIYVCGGVRHFISQSRSSRRSKTVESMDLFKYDFMDKTWHKVARFIEHGSNYTCVYATVNVNLLNQSAFQTEVSLF